MSLDYLNFIVKNKFVLDRNLASVILYLDFYLNRMSKYTINLKN